MPEWPEMENYRRLLSPLVCGQLIRDVAVHREKSVGEPAGDFRDGLIGRRILFLERRAKYLLFHLDDGYRLVLHLMLGGYLLYGAAGQREDAHYQIVLTLEDGNKLFFGGLRLGYLHRMTAKAALEAMKDLGPEPMDPKLTPEAFAARLRGKRGRLKSALTDQSFIAGIGNCYADEICFEAGVSPLASAAALREETRIRLFHAMRGILTEAYETGGYMERPLNGDDTLTGGYNVRLRAYDRGGEQCPRCGGTIRHETASGRKVFYCPSCQAEA